MTKMKQAGGKMVGGAKAVIRTASATKTAGAKAMSEAIRRTSKDMSPNVPNRPNNKSNNNNEN